MSGSLKHSPAQIVRQLLVDLGVGTDPNDDAAWPIYATGEPAIPDAVITVYDTPGRLEGRTHHDGEMQEFNGIQARVRAAQHSTGYVKASAVANAMDKLVRRNSVALGGSEYLVHAITRSSDVLPLGTETPTSKRKLFTVNAVVSLEQTS